MRLTGAQERVLLKVAAGSAFGCLLAGAEILVVRNLKHLGLVRHVLGQTWSLTEDGYAEVARRRAG